MNNPFSKRDRRQIANASIVGKAIGIMVRLPKFFFWSLACLIPHAFRRRVAKISSALLLPFVIPIGWIKVWLITREWKRVLWAAPFFILVVAFSSVYIFYVNTPKSELYANQLRNASVALAQGDYKEADFLLSRLTTVDGLDNRPDLLYQAMIAASQTDRIERATELQTKLTRDYLYAPAMKHSAMQLLEQDRPSGIDIEEGFRLLKMSAEKASTVQQRDENWALYIELALRDGRLKDSLDAYSRIEGFQPRAALHVGQIRLRLGQAEQGLEMIDDLRDSFGNVQLGDFVYEKVATRVIASASADSEEMRLKQLTEGKMILDTELGYIADDNNHRMVNLKTNLLLARALLQLKSPEAQKLALTCLEDLLAAYDNDYTNIGVDSILLDISNPLSAMNIPSESWKTYLTDGVGVNIWHIVSGLSAWANSEEGLAKLHFQIALKAAPRSANIIRSITLSIASSDSEEVKAWLEYANPRRFLKLGRSREEIAIAMLDQLAEMEAPASYATILRIARLKANTRDWHGVIKTIESKYDRFEGGQRASLVQMLLTSYTNSDRHDDAQKLIAAEKVVLADVEPAAAND